MAEKITAFRVVNKTWSIFYTTNQCVFVFKIEILHLCQIATLLRYNKRNLQSLTLIFYRETLAQLCFTITIIEQMNVLNVLLGV